MVYYPGMADYAIPVRRYMSEPVESVAPETSLSAVNVKLNALGISCLAVADADDQLLGVVSRTDLLRIGRHRAGDTMRGPLLDLEDMPVSEIMTRDVLTLAPDGNIADAADAMLKRGVHRVFVTEGGRAVGVISTRDLMAVIVSQRDDTMVSQHMSTPLHTVAATVPLVDAVALLESAHIGGVVVVEDEWPVGMFTQVEALRAAEHPQDTPVEEVMDMSFVCLPAGMRMHRAARQSLRLRTRRVIVVNKTDAVGILTGLDFARCMVGRG
jgi:CBS domain-containing protein